MRSGLAAVAAAVALVGTAACGADGESAASSPSASPSSSQERTYFGNADSSAINETALPAQDALNKANESMQRCDRAADRGGYPAWRRCWHGTLDRAEQGVAQSAEVLERLARKDLPPRCVAELEATAEVLAEQARAVAGLTAGIDSPRRAAQTRALNQMQDVLATAHRTFAEKFQGLTPLCYSPEDLKSIDATPSQSP